MSGIGRRRWLGSLGMLFAASSTGALEARSQPHQTRGSRCARGLRTAQHVARSRTKVPRSRYPAIDIHTHLSFQQSRPMGLG
jgi:hypothetical protein